MPQLLMASEHTERAVLQLLVLVDLVGTDVTVTGRAVVVVWGQGGATGLADRSQTS